MAACWGCPLERQLWPLPLVKGRDGDSPCCSSWASSVIESELGTGPGEKPCVSAESMVNSAPSA